MGFNGVQKITYVMLFLWSAWLHASSIPYTVLFTGEDGNSYFKNGELPLNLDKNGGMYSPIAVENVVFGKSPIEQQKWHNTPRKMFIIVLSGVMQIQTSGGEIKDFEAGTVLLANDVTGKGHLTRALHEEPVNYLAVPLISETKS
ncbi:MAG: hypothetical protein Q8R79_04200 [Legionellaceae bacterium]|nr:hypothetical protein [Legionellaceae bacterium]